ncbi:MAG: hypothetical protein ACLVJH_01550 [Faecalibacterium prausnitzii]
MDALRPADPLREQRAAAATKDPSRRRAFAAEQQRLYDVHGKADILDDPIITPA